MTVASPLPPPPPALESVVEPPKVEGTDIVSSGDIRNEMVQSIPMALFVRKPNCRVCQSPWLEEIEVRAVQSYAYKAIWNILPDDVKADISLGTIRNHLEKHTAAMRRQIILSRQVEAKARGIDIEDFEGRVLGVRGFLQQIIDDASDALVRTGQVKISDAIAAARLILDMEKAESGAESVGLYTGLISVMILEAQQVMSPNQYATWVSRVNQTEEGRQVIQAMARQKEIQTG